MSDYRRIILACLLLVLACSTATALTNIILAVGRCKAEPLNPVHVVLAGNSEPVTSTRFVGNVFSRSGVDKLGNLRIAVRESNGIEHVLLCRIAGAALPLEEGKIYDFQVDYVAGSPSLSGLLIREGAELLCAAASDQRPGGRVLKDDFGFKVELLPTACASRRQDRCYESIRNAMLRVTKADKSVDLVNGESAVLANYRVHCLTAQNVVYRKGCADAGLIALSYAIVRETK